MKWSDFTIIWNFGPQCEVALVQLEAAQFQPCVAKEDSDERPRLTHRGRFSDEMVRFINVKPTKKDNKEDKKSRP